MTGGMNEANMSRRQPTAADNNGRAPVSPVGQAVGGACGSPLAQTQTFKDYQAFLKWAEYQSGRNFFVRRKNRDGSIVVSVSENLPVNQKGTP